MTSQKLNGIGLSRLPCPLFEQAFFWARRGLTIVCAAP